MTLSGLLPLERVVLLRAASKPAALAEMAQLAARAFDLAPPVITQALSAREALGSTGIGGGIALPHARIAGPSTPAALLARLDRPVDWGAIDGKPADIICLLLSPEGADKAHLAALAILARRLRDPQTAASCRAAQNPKDAWRAVTAGSG